MNRDRSGRLILALVVLAQLIPLGWVPWSGYPPGLRLCDFR
jgi:hypothetical protein